MKKIITLVILSICLFQACENKNTKGCENNCCNKKSDNQGSAEKNKIVITDTTHAISCKLSSAELQKRRADVLSVLKTKILEKKELRDGYSFRFENSDEMIDMLSSFIKSERQCCDFFNFAINVKNDGVIWFDLTGPKDAKEIIDSELAL
jgi:hypothetical protein